jgi:peroxiredoxin
MTSKSLFTYTLLFAIIVSLAIFDLFLIKKTNSLKAKLYETNLYNHALQSKLEELAPQKALMPNFNLQDLHGKEFDSDKLNSKLTLLIFFSVSDCPVCLEEARFWEETKVQFSSKGVTVFGIGEAYDRQDLKRFVSVKKLSFPVLFDKNFEVKQKFGDFTTPAKVLVNSKKEILLIQSTSSDIEEQEHTREEFTSVLMHLLAANTTELR